MSEGVPSVDGPDGLGAEVAVCDGGLASRLQARGHDLSGALWSARLLLDAPDEMAGDGRGRWVAASVGPYGAALADGSEYRGRHGLTPARLVAWHRPRLEVLAEAGADLLALETVPDVDEAEALVTLVRGLGVPAWLSYSIDGARSRAGQRSVAG